MAFRELFGTLALLTLVACGEGVITDSGDFEAVDAEQTETATVGQEVRCAPRMSIFPVQAAHNIGYDRSSCGTGTCRTTCPDQNANSDWNPAATHHGVDVFAFQRAPLVAVANGTVVQVGTPSATSGLRVRLRDDCGWEYYYGHLDQAVVRDGQQVRAGQLLGFMGRTGTSGTHLHFNVSPDGQYQRDLNPFDLLRATSATACQAAPAPQAPAAPAPRPCGRLGSAQVLGVNDTVTSCDGRFSLVMQGDGNLVLYQGGRAIWSTGTPGRGGAFATLQSDGNFVLYTRNSKALFSTRTANRPGAILAVQDDGNVVVYQGGVARWASNTGGR